MPPAPDSDSTVHGLDHDDIQPRNGTSWPTASARKRVRAGRLPPGPQPAPQRAHPFPVVGPCPHGPRWADKHRLPARGIEGSGQIGIWMAGQEAAVPAQPFVEHAA